MRTIDDGFDTGDTDAMRAAAVEMVPFSIDVVPTGDGLVIVDVGGELDLSNADQFREALEGSLEDGGREIVVDALDVTFMDSTALGVFVGTARRMPPDGSLLVVCNGDVRRLFRIVGLEQSFRLVDSLQEARETIAGG